jgi:predicted transposase YdaD
MLATLAHLEDPRSAEHAVWTLDALAKWSGDAEGRLADILQAAMPVALLRRVEELMATGRYEYQSDFAKKYYAEGLLAGEATGREEGRIAGQARALCLLLQARGFAVSEALERRIGETRDAACLDAWTRRAVTAASLDEIFSSVPSSQDD